MVFFLFSVMILLTSLPLIFHLKSKKTQSGCKLPPGKTGWPIIGESLEFNSTGLKGAPQKFVLDRMAKFSSDVFTTSLLGETTAVFCGSAGNKFLFSNENKLVNVWFPSSIDKIFPKTSDSRKESAKTYRTCLKGFLRPEALQGYIGVMDSVAKRHLETHWDNKNQVTVGPLVKDFTFLLACKLLLSLDDPKKVEDMANSVALIASGLFSIPIDLPGTQLNCAIKASDLLRVNVHSIVKQRKLDLEENRASPTQDIMSQMLVTSDENGVFMNEMDIAENLIGMLIGGHETLNAAITFLIKYLAEYPHVYDQVYTEQIEIAKSKGPGELLNWEDVHNMKYSWSVVCEVLRLAPPFQGTFREAITDFTYAGFLIPKGLKLYWSTHSTHRNADYFPNPDKFDPSRFEGNGPAPYTFTTFGGGPRMCPGKEYSRLKILVFLHNVVRKYKWEKLIHNEKTIVDPLPRPEKGLPIRLQTHSYS